MTLREAPYIPRLSPAEQAELAERRGETLAYIEVPTPYILTNFAPRLSREDPKAEQRKEKFETERENARKIMHHLKHPGVKNRFRYFWRHKGRREKKQSRDPEKEVDEQGERWEDRDEVKACLFYFKHPAEIPVMVCDFKADRGARYMGTLGSIEPYMESKPSDVVVRWLHIPIGVGILQSSIEERFNYTGSQTMGKAFTDAGMTGFPYLANIHTLAFYDFKYFQEQLAAWNVLSKFPNLQNGPRKSLIQDLDPKQTRDLHWRSNYLHKELNFWDMTKADFPYLVSECSIGDLNPRNRELPDFLGVVNPPAVAEMAGFKDSLMMISHFRAFHRSDGFLLTFTPQPGVGYLGKDFRNWIDPSNDLLMDPDASAIGFASSTFLTTGTQKWHRKTVEWFLVYLVTELLATPNNHRQGNSAPTLTNGYHQVAADLRTRQKLPWQRGESEKLVRRYLNYLDELRVMVNIAKRKKQLLEALAKDTARIEDEYKQEGLEEYNGPDPHVDSMKARVEWALNQQNTDIGDLEILLSNVQTASNELVDLRSIEQNELAIVADSHSKAILAFTFVTVIFLPLSFFTSYFGMNLRDLINDDKNTNQRFFWKTCGVLSFSMVALTAVYAFRAGLVRKVKFALYQMEGGMFGPRGQPLAG